MPVIANLKTRFFDWEINEDGVYTFKNEDEDVEYSIYWETNGYTATRNGDILGFDLLFDLADNVCATDLRLAQQFKEQMENEL